MSLWQNEHLLRSAKNNLCGHPGEIVLGVALLRFRAISQLILARNIFLSISLRRSFCKRLLLNEAAQLTRQRFYPRTENKFQPQSTGRTTACWRQG